MSPQNFTRISFSGSVQISQANTKSGKLKSGLARHERVASPAQSKKTLGTIPSNSIIQMERRGRSRGRGFRGRGPRRGRLGPGRAPHRTYVQVSKPLFYKVKDLCPEMTGINVSCEVVEEARNVHSRTFADGKQINIWEILIGDETGSIVLGTIDPGIAKRARVGCAAIVRNGFIKMKDNKFMRLNVDKFGKIEVTSGGRIRVDATNNLSEVEYQEVFK